MIRALLLSLMVLALDAVLLALALGGVGALWSHPRALALLSVWFVNNLTLAVVRPVRSQDAIETKPDAPLVMLTLFLAPLLAPPLSALGERLGVWSAPLELLGPAARVGLAWAGVVIAALGLALRFAAMVQLGSRFSPRIAVQRNHVLEATGVYGRVRHPGYLGALVATAGAVLAFSSLLGWPLFAAMAVAQVARARREEALLDQHFGDAWRDYRAHTGLLWPPLGRSRRVG